MKSIRLRALLIVIAMTSSSIGQDSASKVEPFPQSAKLARDRRSEAILETARAQLRQKDYPAAIVALQELLDGPNSFVGGGAAVPSFVDEATRLLLALPPTARDVYERTHGAEANRLWQQALQSGRTDALREVVVRFGATTAGWSALRDLAVRHVDRGEWGLAAAASNMLARHPHSTVTKESGWIARWILAESRATGREESAQNLIQQYRKSLDASPAPEGAPEKNLAQWLEKRLPLKSKRGSSQSSSQQAGSRDINDERPAIGLAPSGQRILQIEAGLSGDPAGWLKDIVTDWFRYDVPILASAHPLLVGDVLVARFAQPAKVVAVDVRQGKLLWEQPLIGSIGATATDLQQHPGFRTPLLEEWQRRWFGDSVRGRMTSDGRRIFLIRDLEDLDLKPGAGSRLRNHLEAWDLATGERRWRIGSSVNEPPTGFEGLYFLGAPLVSDGLLYVIAQRELQAALWVLRANDGQLEWTLPLAETDRQQFKEVGWRHVGCPVSWASGRLICPTGAGCFVAVDPITRSLAWALRFERDDISQAMGFLAADREHPFPVRWWESWRQVESRELRAAIRDSDKQSLLLLASPESRSLRAVRSDSGEIAWRAKFKEPLFMAANDSIAMIFERGRVTALDPASGQKRWQSLLPNLAGTGDWAGENYVCLLSDGGWAMIEATTGTIHRSSHGVIAGVTSSKLGSADHSFEFTGRLLRVGQRWAVLSPNHLQLFEPLDQSRSQLTKRSELKPEDAETRLELASVLRELGETKRAEELIRPLLDEPSAADKARISLQSLLLKRLDAAPADHSKIKEDLLRLSPDGRLESEWNRAIIEAALKSGHLVDALPESLEFLDRIPEADLIEGPGFRLNDSKIGRTLDVRKDRWAQGIITDLLAQADAATRSKLEVVLIERRQRAFDSPDTFALQSLSDRWNCLPIGRELRMQRSGRTGTGVGYLKTSLALLEIAQGSDRVAAAQAWYRLALLHDFRSEALDAADCYRELQDHFADVKLTDGHTTEEWLSDVMPESAIGKILSEGPRDPWPAGLPKIASQEEPHDDVYCYLIPFESRAPFWRRVTVSVERQGRKVRFHGAGQHGFWEFPLPASNSPFRHDWHAHRGWGIGPLLVLQVGDSLYGIQPLDERGETNAKLVWQISTGPYEEIGPQQFLPAQLGVRLDDFLYLDRYEQPVLNVVHASPGLLCYRTRNRLIAIDPATGTQLWTRRNLPPAVSVAGDGEHIILHLNSTRELEVRRGFDGKLVSSRVDDVASTSVLLDQGSQRVLLDSVKADAEASPRKMVCEDLISGAMLWQRELPQGSAVLRVDDSRIAVVERPGTLRFLSLSNGQEQAKQDIPLPNSLTTAYVFGDDLRLFVVLAGPVTEVSWLATQQDRGGYRKPLLNGWLHAFDRRTLQLLWTIPAKNLPLAIDQPKDTPFLVLAYKRPSDDSVDGQSPEGVLHLIDKRTGKEVLYEAGNINNVYFALEPDVLQQRVDLLTPKRRIRLDYAAE